MILLVCQRQTLLQCCHRCYLAVWSLQFEFSVPETGGLYINHLLKSVVYTRVELFSVSTANFFLFFFTIERAAFAIFFCIKSNRLILLSQDMWIGMSRMLLLSARECRGAQSNF